MEKTISNLLTELANQLQTSIPFLWGVLIKQAYVNAAMNLFYTAIILLCSFLYGKIYLRKCKENPGYSPSPDYEDMPWMLFGGIILCIAFFYMVFALIPETITCLINPEYWALEKILDKL